MLLVGEPGSGKSDLLLRLIDVGFDLVADDRVEIEDGRAWAPAALAGLVEVRGFGIVRFPFVAQARLAVVARMGRGERLPHPSTHMTLPAIWVDPGQPSSCARIRVALRCLAGDLSLVAGAFA